MNYQKELEKIILQIETLEPKKDLLLHSCCAPCSSYVLEYLQPYFNITVYFFNPNITDQKEYNRRVEEQKRYIREWEDRNLNRSEIKFLEGCYEPDQFYQIAKGLETEREGGERCLRCYELRLRQTALEAKRQGLDFFTTTLTISPLKNAEKLNILGQRIGEEIGISFLPSDFKKEGGYLKSVELSKEYNLYRQDYCGCIYSKVQREKERKDMHNA